MRLRKRVSNLELIASHWAMVIFGEKLWKGPSLADHIKELHTQIDILADEIWELSEELKTLTGKQPQDDEKT